LDVVRGFCSRRVEWRHRRHQSSLYYANRDVGTLSWPETRFGVQEPPISPKMDRLQANSKKKTREIGK
jgi:hypothetical protein